MKQKPIIRLKSKIAKTKKSRSSFQKDTWNQQILKAVQIAEKLNFTVNFSRKNKYNHVVLSKHVIFIKSTHKKEIQFYALMHELGHIKLSLQSDYNKEYLKYRDRSNTYLNRVEVLLEEISAWNIAHKLISKQKFFVNKIALDKYKSQCIASYAKWVARRETIKFVHQEANQSKDSKTLVENSELFFVR